MIPFALYEDGAILAVGDTPQDALEKAQAELDVLPSILWVAQISPDLARHIQTFGWNRQTDYFVVLNGWLVDVSRRL